MTFVPSVVMISLTVSSRPCIQFRTETRSFRVSSAARRTGQRSGRKGSMANDASQNPVDWPSLAKSLVSALSRPEAGQRELVPTQVLEVCAGAFAAGFARGRWGKVEVGGV